MSNILNLAADAALNFAANAALPFHNLDPVAFRIPTFGLFGIDGLPIRWYGLAYMAGIICAWICLGRLVTATSLWASPPAHPQPPSREAIDDLGFWAIFGIVVGGRLGHVLFYNTEILWTRPAEILQLWNGGMSFHGGFLGVALVVVLVARQHRVKLLTLADICAPAATFGLFFGRMANFVNGELYGRPTDLPWGMVFPAADGSGAFTDPRHPSQLYEAGLEGIALAVILLSATVRGKSLRRPGLNCGLFLLFYGIFRIAMEQFRQPDDYLPEFLQGSLTMGGLLSLPMVAIGAFMVWRALRPAGSAARPA